MLLDDVRVVSIALNLPGPAACGRLREMGATVVKVEPPGGDPLEAYVPAWYREIHSGIERHRLDLKAGADRERFDALLRAADLLVTAQRPAALARLGLAPDALRAAFPRLCLLRILGHPPPHEDDAGHDLTYLAAHGLVSPGTLPPTLFADMAGAERAATVALALLHARDRSGQGAAADVYLEDAAEWLARPRRHGLTGPGTLLGGNHAGYNLYATRDGWIALAALEPHFARRVMDAFSLEALEAAALAERFRAESSDYWSRWARERDVPLVALPSSLP